MNRKVRVRFAPSPTGPLHMGGVRTALYNYLFAKQNHGDFILRIEDTDQNRFVPGAEEYIIEALKWSGIIPNEGVGFGDGPHAPYRQSERKGLYKQYADQLVKSGHAYYAFDEAEALEQLRKEMESRKQTFAYNALSRVNLKNSLTLSAAETEKLLSEGTHYVIRLKVPGDEEVHLTDIIRGEVKVHTSQMDDKVLFKSDGMPTYHLANVVDDYLMKITHVIRGEEWLPSAPLHVLLYRYLGWENVMPQFAHLPLLLKPDGNGKLSKRDGDRLGFPVFPLNWTDPETKELSSGYREKGYYPAAFVNMLSLLGWHPNDEQELFTMDGLIKAFSLERVSKSGAKFDPEKTKWFNEQYLRLESDYKIVERIRSELINEMYFNNDDYRLSNAFLSNVVRLMKNRVAFEKDIYKNSSQFEVIIDNFNKINEFEFEFDILMKSIIEVLNIRTVQFGLEVSKEFIGDGKATIQIIEKHKNITGGPNVFWDHDNKLIKITSNVGVKHTLPTVITIEPSLLFRIRVKSDTHLLANEIKMSFNLNSKNRRYPTVITQWDGAYSVVITNSGTFKGINHIVNSNKLNYFFERQNTEDIDVIKKRWNLKYTDFFIRLLLVYNETHFFNSIELENIFNRTAITMNYKPTELLQLFRLMLSGQSTGVGLFELTELLGRKEVLSRIESELYKLILTSPSEIG